MARHNIDHRHLAKLQDYYARHGALPSYAGISEVLGFRAKNAAVKLTNRLLRSGYVRRTPDGRVVPDTKFFHRQLASAVRAGAPDMVDDSSVELTSIDRYLIDKPSQAVMIRVRGESMMGAGIHDGDIAVVERKERAERGDFVVARIDGEFTLKEFDVEGRQPILRPHNEGYNVIKMSREMQIFGVVIGLFRRYVQAHSRKSRQR